MDDDLHRDGYGRSTLIFAAVALVTAASVAAAWFTMGDGSSSASSTEVLAERVEAGTERPLRATTSTSTPTTSPAPATTTSSTTTTGPITSTGRFLEADGTGELRGTGEAHTYTVEAEEGSGVDPNQLAAVVDIILQDPRGWTAKGHSFLRVPAGGSFTISLASPETADAICLPLDTAGIFSCHKGHRVVLNLTRWNEGTTDLPLDLNGYRAQVVNHEVGHELGLGHVGCAGDGLYAPVMMQQSKGLDGCLANPWPTLDYTAPR